MGSDGGGVGYPRTSWVTMATSLAARNNHLEALTWLTSNGCPVSDIQAMKWAAGGGHVRILAFLKGRNYFWDSIVCAQAALGGKLETLQWLRANGCPWGEKTCDFAAFKGHLKILEWARENGCPASRWLCTSTAAYVSALLSLSLSLSLTHSSILSEKLKDQKNAERRDEMTGK